MYGTPSSATPASKMSTMCALSTALAACASRWKRFTASLFLDSSALTSLIATRLPMAVLTAS